MKAVSQIHQPLPASELDNRALTGAAPSRGDAVACAIDRHRSNLLRAVKAGRISGNWRIEESGLVPVYGDLRSRALQPAQGDALLELSLEHAVERIGDLTRQLERIGDLTRQACPRPRPGSPRRSERRQAAPPTVPPGDFLLSGASRCQIVMRGLDPRTSLGLARQCLSYIEPANRSLTMLKAALNRAFHGGRVASDTPWRKVKPFGRVEKPVIRYLSADEARRLVNACPQDFRRLVQAALLTGCRYSELTNLRCTDFNTDSDTLTIRQAKAGKTASRSPDQ
jgi:hypothetical protein